MRVLGNLKQERKIEELGSIVHRMFPLLDKLAIKGCFRRGIQSTLNKMNIEQWDMVAGQRAEFRERFFKNILQESVPILQGMGLNVIEIRTLREVLLKANRKYLTD